MRLVDRTRGNRITAETVEPAEQIRFADSQLDKDEMDSYGVGSIQLRRQGLAPTSYRMWQRWGRKVTIKK